MLWAHELFLRLKPNDLIKPLKPQKSIPVTLIRRLMPSSIDSETLVNTEKGFLCLQRKVLLENETQNGNMKKNVHFASLFPWNLALITHNAPSSVNPSISRNFHGQMVRSFASVEDDNCLLGIFQWLLGLNHKYRSKQNTDKSTSCLFIDHNNRDLAQTTTAAKTS